MKNQGKTLEPLARKLRKASEGDAAADAKSRLRLLSDEVVRVALGGFSQLAREGLEDLALVLHL